MIALAAAVALIAAGTPPARQAGPTLPSCGFPRSVSVANRLSELPAPARGALARLAGRNGVAEAGGAWQRTDVVHDRTLPRTRFVRAYRFGTIWIVWFERGGIAYNVTTAALRPAPAGGGYDVVAGPWRADDLCASTRALLDDATSGRASRRR